MITAAKIRMPVVSLTPNSWPSAWPDSTVPVAVKPRRRTAPGWRSSAAGPAWGPAPHAAPSPRRPGPGPRTIRSATRTRRRPAQRPRRR
ncbi:hypothetical protein G6F46_015451 [Rhizopus delemar]|nr:hypothetical protein G6F23_015492 [Rhizopus arrhizus]KAG1580860.1 hypothetical protein G6F46_015451 [Rhizopus delemar]